MASATSSATPTQNPEPRLCWICQQDETEDESPMVWRAPCPCTLTAHDSCLLEWITSQELSKKDQGKYNSPIQCPQCQAIIEVERPHDYLVQAYTAIDGVIGACVIPTALSGLLGCVYSGFLVYGMNTVQMVFGRMEAESILSHVYPRTSLSARWLELTRETLRWSVTMFDPFFPEIKTNSDWRIFIGLPLIGPCLILSRTQFADRALPMLLPLYFLDPRHHRFDLTRPLTPGFAFATLPYIRATYNKTYEYFITPHEKRWEQAVLRQPREGETAADIAAEAQDEGGPLIEIQVVEEIVGEEDNFEVLGQPENEDGRPVIANGVNGQRPVEAQQLPVQAEQDPQIPQPLNAGINQPQPANVENDNWQIRQDIPLRQVMITTMGALFFPTVASYSGEFLRHALPARWVYKHAGNRSIDWSGGLLREKWGRTVIGGCLFVLLKDAVTLYVKWKRAKDFGKRKILDYTGPRRRVP